MITSPSIKGTPIYLSSKALFLCFLSYSVADGVDEERFAAMGRKSRHTDEKRNVPNKGEPVGTKKRNYTTKYYPNKSEWVPVSVKMSISSVSRCSQTSNQSG